MLAKQQIKVFLGKPLHWGLLIVAAVALADEPIVLESSARQVSLVELYTSEGCSSCPPADGWLANFSGSDRLWREIVPVAYHVTYWNYLGWEDRLALPAFDRRVPVGAFRRKGTTAQIFNRRIVRSDHAGPGTSLDRHVADRHTGVHVHG